MHNLPQAQSRQDSRLKWLVHGLRIEPIYGTSRSAGFHPLGSCEPLGVVVDHGAFREGPDAGVAGRSLDARGRRESRVSASPGAPRQEFNSKARNVPLTERAVEVSKTRGPARTGYVFQAADGQPIYQTWLNRQHSALRTLLKLAVEFVPHSFRHTHGTRLGEAGADAFYDYAIDGTFQRYRFSKVRASVSGDDGTRRPAAPQLKTESERRRAPADCLRKSLQPVWPRAEKCSKSFVFKYARVAK